MERIKEEKNLWIDSKNMVSGTSNNFYYNIGNILYKDNYKKLKVKLVDCVISKNYSNDGGVVYPVSFYLTFIKIYINLNVYGNSLNNNNYGLLFGLINNQSTTLRLGLGGGLSTYNYSNNGCAKLNDNKIKYYLNDIPTGIININIIGYNNITGTYIEKNLADLLVNPPSNVLICLKFTYEF